MNLKPMPGRLRSTCMIANQTNCSMMRSVCPGITVRVPKRHRENRDLVATLAKANLVQASAKLHAAPSPRPRGKLEYC